MQEREERARRRMAGEDEQSEDTPGAKITIQEQCEQLPITKEDISYHNKNVKKSETSEETEMTNISSAQELCDDIQSAKNKPLLDVPSKADQDLVHEHNLAKYNEPQDVQVVNTLTAGGKESPCHDKKRSEFKNSEISQEKEDTMTSDMNTNLKKNQIGLDLPKVDDLQAKFASLGLSFNFTKNVAAMAAAQSHHMASLNVDTFGDSENSEEENETELIQ